MRKEGSEFGILAFNSLPDDALSNTDWREGVLIVKPENIEPAYVFLRQYLILKKDLEMTFEEKFLELNVKETVMQELQNAIRSGELDRLIQGIDASADKLDDEFTKMERYLEKVIKSGRRETKKIRDCTMNIMSNHVEKIRMQLLDQFQSTLESRELEKTQ